MEELKTEKAGIAAEPEFATLDEMVVVAEGGMSTVYRARDRLLDRIVAIKIMKETGVDQNMRARFEQEAKVLASLRHPNIVAIHKYGLLSNGLPYLIMDFIPGMDLREFLEDRKDLSGRLFFSIFSQVLHALSESHKQNILHRDIKPENIMISKANAQGQVPSKMTTQGFDFHVYLLDFGIAKVALNTQDKDSTFSGPLLGTPKYMNPEQCTGQVVVESSDLYSLACIMFEVIFGEVPFQQSNPAKLLYQRINDDPADLFSAPGAPAVSAALKALLLKGLARQPRDRFQSADEMLEAMNNLAASDLEWRIKPEKRWHKLSFVPLIATVVFVLSFSIAWHLEAPELEALQKSQLFVPADPKEIDASLARSKELAEQKKVKEAYAYLNRAYKLACRNKDVDRQTEITRFELDFQRVVLKNPKGEIACCKRLAELSKRYISSNGLHFECIEMLARALADDGKLEEAIATMQRAIDKRKVRQQNSGIRSAVHDRNEMAIWYNKLHQLDKAREQLEYNWNLQKDLKGGNAEDAFSMIETARLTALLGEPEKAREHLKHIATLIPPLMEARNSSRKDVIKVYDTAINIYGRMNLPDQKATFEKLYKQVSQLPDTAEP